MDQANWHAPTPHPGTQVGRAQREFDEVQAHKRHLIENFEFQEAQKLEHFRIAKENARRRKSLERLHNLHVWAWILVGGIAVLVFAIGGGNLSSILSALTLLGVFGISSHAIWVYNKRIYAPLDSYDPNAVPNPVNRRHTVFDNKHVARRRMS